MPMTTTSRSELGSSSSSSSPSSSSESQTTSSYSPVHKTTTTYPPSGQACRSNAQCVIQLACMSGHCKNPCDTMAPCGPGATCKVMMHRAVCSCPRGYEGDPKRSCQLVTTTPKPICERDNDCPYDRACIKEDCRNPCDWYKPCAQNAQCKSTMHRATCSCLAGYEGNPLVSCTRVTTLPPPICVRDSDCSPHQACIKDDCRSPCDWYKPCGPNAECRVNTHRAACLCLPGYEGNPLIQCERAGCKRDSECPFDKVCRNRECVDPCRTGPFPCGINAICRPTDHAALCSCPPEHTGDARHECRKLVAIEPQCRRDSDCPHDKACVRETCRNPCTEVARDPCGTNAICNVRIHRPTCSCPPNYVGNPLIRCVPSGCRSDTECPSHLACIDTQCQNPCIVFPNSCGRSAECFVDHHQARCRCPAGLRGNAHIECLFIECERDEECPIGKACIREKCQNPCEVERMCAPSAQCLVPLHKATCVCPEGSNGNPLVECKIRRIEECYTDADCASGLACIEEKCQNPCPILNPCGPKAVCKVIDTVPWRTMVCVCPPGFMGDAQRGCMEVPKPKPECTSDQECPGDKACVSNHCRNPCSISDNCGINARCEAINHRPSCSCLPDYIGDPYRECQQAGCQSNSDCAFDKACIQRECVDPCYVKKPCHPTAHCKSIHHEAQCYCPSGMKGDPFVGCIAVECFTNQDCPADRGCYDNHCRNPCTVNNQCGRNALCEPRNHLATCSCPPDLEGDPLVECRPRAPPPQCITDADCPSGLACISEKCQNPCIVLQPCKDQAECKVIDTVPWRTMVCVCPNGFVATPNRGCEKQIDDRKDEFECRNDDQCADNQACEQRTCVNPCDTRRPCASNAQCHTYRHRPICDCPPGFYGDPRSLCIKLECTHDQDCANDKTCHNNQCVNPCLLDNGCGQNAICRPKDHRSQCECQPGYKGNPLMACVRIECQSDPECPFNRACIQEHCRNPCEDHRCGHRALCTPQNHQPVCSCPPGFTGNAQHECTLIITAECITDADCPSSQACIREKCQNPCHVLRPCQQGAECKVIDTVPWRSMVCVCPSGYQATINRGCEKIPIPGACQSDFDCDLNKACIEGMCDDPCRRLNECGRGALCSVPNHRAVCSCPSNTIGNPRVECVSVECQQDSDCAPDKACRANHCVNLCSYSNPCGINAQCKMANHRQECECISGFQGDPLKECKYVECRDDSECPGDRTCFNHKCDNPCVITPCPSRDMLCTARNHKAECECPPGFMNKELACSRVDVIKYECVTDGDCPSGHACIDRVCQNPCLVLRPCGSLAECKVIDTVPWRTMICVCPEGYMGDPNRGCVPVPRPPPEPKGCQYDSECNRGLACLQGDCKDPCLNENPCAPEAICQVPVHRPVCSCPPRFFGDPRVKCEKIICSSDNECPFDKACRDNQCVDLCLVLNPCGTHADCTMVQHRQKCECIKGYQGDPLRYCKQVECQVDDDCPDPRACVNGKCERPCLFEKCGKNANCDDRRHKAVCSCPPGMTGNPQQECVIEDTSCKTDADCPSGLACMDRQCQNPCLAVRPCGPLAECKVIDTVPWRSMVCVCPNGYVGDMQRGCTLVPLQDGCKSDSECPDHQGCINRQCQDPCPFTTCGVNAVCEASQHRAVCSCPPRYIGNPRVSCQRGECLDDSQCPLDRSCLDNKCVDSCLFNNPCGPGAECRTENHVAICYCPVGWRGDPRIECREGECQSDSECTDDRACIDKHCKDPCVEPGHNRCRPETVCFTTNHRAECKCPDGFNGDPLVACSRVDTTCQTDEDCPSGLSCISEECQNPCLVLSPCGPHAECKVLDTVPWRSMICICPNGYMSDSKRGCIKIEIPPTVVGCLSDSDCPFDKACINHNCENPCLLGRPCGEFSTCKPINHRALCVCIDGYIGQPEVGCYLAGCISDQSCPDNARCSNRICEDVCATKPCHPNAQCRGIGHQPQCTCKPGFEGDGFNVCVHIEECHSDSDCADTEKCIIGQCRNPCEVEQCGSQAICLPKNHQAECICVPPFHGNAYEFCTERIDRNVTCSDRDCPENMACIDGVCRNLCEQSNPCGRNAECQVINTHPLITLVCVCLPGHVGDATEECQTLPGCTDDNECPGNLICRNNECSCWPNLIQVQDFCIVAISRNCTTTDECPVNEECQPLVRRCYCPKPNILHPSGTCESPPNLSGKTVPPPAEYPPTGSVVVNCRADGIHVDVPINEQFDGVVYVKGYSKDESCRRVVYRHDPSGTMPFIVRFNTCGLIPIDGIASFILVIQRHPKLVTHKARAYDVKCVYHTGEKTISLAFNVSMITTSGTIANTGPPPTCIMRICNSNGEDISTAEIGEILMLKLEVTPKNVYGGFARSCYALPMEDGKESYPVTDENGCALDPAVFGEWSYDEVKQVLLASFNAFKFPNGNTIRFQCDVKVCFGQCQPVNCNGVDAYGRRRKRQARTGIEKDVGDDASLANRNTVDEYTKITMNSNAIQVVDRRDQQAQQNATESGELQKPDEVCVSMTGLIIALVITALLALVAIAVAVSCWLMAYRRKPKGDGPLPHPADFPNPLYTTPEPIMEPSPDYLS